MAARLAVRAFAPGLADRPIDCLAGGETEPKGPGRDVIFGLRRAA